MVLDLGFLGDTVHLLPALWVVRQAYPDAELHVAVASHVVSFLDCTPWINRVWGYMRFPRHATLRENIDMVMRLRREEFDVLINLQGSERSSWLTFSSGAQARLLRNRKKRVPLWWRGMDSVELPNSGDIKLVYQNKCICLALAGFPSISPEFHVKVPASHLRAADISDADIGTYFHISPFTTADRKELSPKQLAEFIVALTQHFADKKIVLSCAPDERERNKMAELLKLLPEKPWRVFAGNLSLIQVAAVIKYSAIHFGGDTGTLHLATMTQAHTVAWFWPSNGVRNWINTSDKCRVIMGENGANQNFLCNISTDELIRATRGVLEPR